MTTDSALNGAGDAGKTDDSLRGALAAAIASQDEADAPAKPDGAIKEGDATEKGKSKPAAKAAGADGGKKAEAGKEAASKVEVDKKVEAKAKVEIEAGADKATETEAGAGDADKKADAREAPASWSAADREMFKVLPETAQQFLVKRHNAMEADYTKKTQALGRLKSEYEPVDKLFDPYRDVMKQKGFSPRSLIEAWANVETRLSAGADSAAEVIKGLVSGYKIPVDKITAALGIKAPAVGAAAGDGKDAAAELPKPQGDGAQPIQLPPEIAATLARLNQRAEDEDRRNAAQARFQRDAAETRINTEIEQFKSAKDGEGNLLHPHFDEVEDDMTALANVAVAKKQPVPPLKELYEKAVWATPATREKLRTAEEQAAEKKRDEAARAKAAAAKRAGSSVTGAPGASQATARARADDLPLREQLEAAFEETA